MNKEKICANCKYWDNEKFKQDNNRPFYSYYGYCKKNYESGFMWSVNRPLFSGRFGFVEWRFNIWLRIKQEINYFFNKKYYKYTRKDIYVASDFGCKYFE